MTKSDEKKLIRRKRIIAVNSAAVVVVLACFLTYVLGVKFSKIASSGIEFKEYIQSFGTFGFLVAIAIQVLQVVIAIIPGEVIEIGIGYAYGWLGGMVISLIGVAIGSSLIFKLVKKFGIRFVELFVHADKINELRFFNSEKKLRRTTFLLYFIPGTPKDLLTYFIGLTRMTLSEFLSLTLIARLPSLVTSIIGGSFVGDGKYLEAVILFIITAVISLLGLKLYKILTEKARKKFEKSKLIHRFKK